jgi:hypothetical protein
MEVKMDKATDEIIGVFLLIVGLAIIIQGVILLIILWVIISAAYAKYINDKYFKEAEEDFDDMMRELNIDLPIDDILGSVGIHLDENGSFDSVVDMVAGDDEFGTPLGETGV